MKTSYFTSFCHTCAEKTVHELAENKLKCLVCKMRKKGVIEMPEAYKEGPTCFH